MARRIEDHPGVLDLNEGTLEDKELTLAFQSGDKGAYQAIHDRHAQRVHRVCRRMLGPDDAQEAAQEAFLRVYQALGRFNGRYQLGPWITRIATNVCLDHLRARSRRPSDPVPNELLVLDERVLEGDSEPERLLVQDAETRHVRSVLAKLPPLHRAAIVLRDFEGLSYEEVAVALQITEGQTKALIHRARQNFKRSWTKSLSVLLPWRLIDRLRGLEGSARDHTAEVLSAAQTVSSCTGMLQQCGQYVSHGVATVVAAALVGSVAGVASHAVTRPSTPESPSTRSATSANAPAPRSYKVLSQTAPRDPESEVTKAKAHAAEPSEPGTVLPEPEPSVEESPSPAPTPAETAPPSPSPAPQPSETPRTAPQPFAPAVGFDYGRSVAAYTPRSHSATVSCTKDYLEQRLETVIEDDDSGATYPALLLLHWDGSKASALSLEFTVWKNGVEIYYSGNAELVDGSYPDGQRKVSFLGDYGTYDEEEARSMDLPSSGRFSAGLTLDCAALSVITESVVLGT